MTYIVQWAVFIDDDSPMEAARKARALVPTAQGTTWKVTELDSGEITVVDVETGGILYPHGGADNAELAASSLGVDTPHP